MTTSLAEKYDSQVPRYTSYPTTPHFSEAVTGETYANWLSALAPVDGLSLYFHIPFCASMCAFCGCYTKIVKRYQPIAEYLETLMAEVDIVADALPNRMRATHLHWGGGSPTMLTADDFARLVTKLRDRFDVTPGAEIAIELDPRTATEEYIAAIAAAGINRVSIGAQDFAPKVQEAIHRIQTYETTAQVVDWLHRYGITALNVDLIYGLPHQRTEDLIDSIDKTIELGARRVALFGYAHVPWKMSHQKLIPEEALPDIKERFTQFEAGARHLEEKGFTSIGLDHFARAGDDLAEAARSGNLHRNFQGYTTDPAAVLVGMGASAIGTLPQGYVQNHPPLAHYRRAIEAGRLPTVRGIQMSDEDRLRRVVIEQLMCNLEVDLAPLCQQYGIEPGHFDKEISDLAPLIADGIVQTTGSHVTMGSDARPFVRLVAATFDTYLEEGQQRHSKAV